jgi:cytochrome P460
MLDGSSPIGKTFMSGKRILLTTIFAVLLSGALAAIISLSGSRELEGKSLVPENSRASGSEVVDGYKQWTRVNPEPAVFHSQIAIQCARPTTEQAQMEQANPHRDKFITVYVNDIGRHAMMQERVPRFPQGSVIVKEKLPRKEDSAPELLTVMVKREPGYNPQNGDWEYMALDGSGESVQARGRLESCQACHMMVKDRDYVSRNYLPYDVWKKLK